MCPVVVYDDSEQASIMSRKHFIAPTISHHFPEQAPVPCEHMMISKEPQKRQQPFLFGKISDVSKGWLFVYLDSVRERAEGLLRKIENDKKLQHSYVGEACRRYLTSMSQELDGALYLLKNTNSEGEFVCGIMGNVITSFPIFGAVRSLDAIESTLKFLRVEKETELIKLLHTMSSPTSGSLGEGKQLFRVSTRKTRSLIFDVLAGCPARSCVSEDSKQLPLSINVEPVVEIQAEYFVDRDYPLTTSCFKSCFVEIDKVTHEASSHIAGRGTIGVATVRMNISPVMQQQCERRPRACIWGRDKTDVERVNVKEARVLQLNAEIPRAVATADMFVSTTYGSSTITVFLIVKTYKSVNDESPRLHIDLVVGKSSF